jgi:hypothetical protein
MEDDVDAAALSDNLAEFLTSEAERAAVAAALPQLLAAARAPPGAGHDLPWLAAPPAPPPPQAHALASLQFQVPGRDAGAAAASSAADPPAAAAAQPAAAVVFAAFGGLNVGATEFKQSVVFQPSCARLYGAEEAESATGAAADRPLEAGGAGWGGGGGSGGGGESWGADPGWEAGSPAAARPQDPWHPGDSHGFQSCSQHPSGGGGRPGALEGWGGGGGGALPAGPASEEAFLAVLGQQFPEYSLPALRTLFSQCGGSLSATVDTICALEAELSGQLHAASAPPPPPPPAVPEPEFTADDFPTLGGGGGGGGGGARGGASAGGGDYARRAKAAAARPTPPSAVARAALGAGFGVGGGGGGGGGGAAPVWQSSGVQRFSTGAAAAADYADARAAASDHARLRNAHFQQATAAYLAGNRALAKELGRRGREHNEAMHAAHAAAASDTFSRRNAATLATAGGGGGGGVPTIDLHALHVAEAVTQLEAALDRLRRGGARAARVVVGVGQHGRGPARLPAAVRSALGDWGLRHREIYAGLLEVTLA